MAGNNKKYMSALDEARSSRLSLTEGMGIQEQLAERRKKTFQLTAQSDQSAPIAPQSNGAFNQASTYSNAASAMSAGQDTQSSSSGAINGALSGAAVGTAISPGYGTVIGAGVGALSGIMNAKANQQAAKIKAEQEKAKAMADLYGESGKTQQNALANLMASYNNILR